MPQTTISAAVFSVPSGGRPASVSPASGGAYPGRYVAGAATISSYLAPRFSAVRFF